MNPRPTLNRIALTAALAGVCFLGSAGAIAGAARASTRSRRSLLLRPLALGSISAAPEAESEREGSRELAYKVVNFLILVGALGYLLRKPLRDFLAGRSEAIRKCLDEGRKALEASQAQLQAIENKLRNLEEEIARFKAASAQEMQAERERLRRAAEAEAERMLEFARAQIESAARAARLELKAYAAGQAVDLAEQMVRERLDEAGRRRLVDRFVREVSQRAN